MSFNRTSDLARPVVWSVGYGKHSTLPVMMWFHDSAATSVEYSSGRIMAKKEKRKSSMPKNQAGTAVIIVGGGFKSLCLPRALLESFSSYIAKGEEAVSSVPIKQYWFFGLATKGGWVWSHKLSQTWWLEPCWWTHITVLRNVSSANDECSRSQEAAAWL